MAQLVRPRWLLTSIKQAQQLNNGEQLLTLYSLIKQCDSRYSNDSNQLQLCYSLINSAIVKVNYLNENERYLRIV